jgi:large subunit ribosomal protein L24
MNLKKNDQVLIISGKDRGKKGKVIKALPALGKIVVDGLNKAKKHTKPTSKQPHGGILEFSQAIDASNARLICPNCAKLTHATTTQTKDQKNIRVCQKCNSALETKVDKG